MRCKNQSKHFFKFLFAGLLFLVLLCTLNPVNVKADELFFDEDGNLFFHTKDRKATGDVRYKTLGWIIKRYDMPIDAIGQQYVIVQKVSYRPNEPDPEDDTYVLSYFKSDRDEILNAVKSVSEEWYGVLTGYGDDVYIDSVMTVNVDWEDCGTLYKDGTYEGEVYLTYEGIANARGWTNISVERLKTHFDMELHFPQQVKKWEPYAEIINTEYIRILTSRYAAFTLGAGSYGHESFDILSGIPSGENLYLRGVADSTQAALCLKKVTARLTECVEVPITYVLQWVDYYGEKKEETRLIYRYYPVKREFTYYEYISFDEYWLSDVKLSGGVLGETLSVDIDVYGNEKADIDVITYGSYENHMLGYTKYSLPNIGTVLLTGSGGKKPAIPNADYSNIADEQISDVRVRNDKIIIEQKLVLSDKTCIKNGEAPSTLFETKSADIYSEGIGIPTTVANGLYDDSTVSLTYIDKYNRPVIFKHSCGDVVVHTPVYCESDTYVEKELNQAVQPTERDVVLGEEFTVAFNDFGLHRDIRGYGLLSYAKYVGIRQVYCPFAVIYEGVYYDANTWINVSDYNVRLVAYEGNAEGNYTILTRVLAYNGPDKTDMEHLEERANLSVTAYGAWSSMDVRLIGRLHKLQLEYGDDTYTASSLPLEIIPANDETNCIQFELVGDVESDDSIQLTYSYYHENKDGSLEPVDVYGVRDRTNLDKLSEEELMEGRLTQEQTLSTKACVITDNVSSWSVTNTLYSDYIVVPKGTTITDIYKAIVDDDKDNLIYDGGYIIVCVDITSYKKDTPHLSYINEENASKGYCNMWLREGGTREYPYGAVTKLMIEDYAYYEYEVSGTH